MQWRRKWQPTPVFLPGEFQGWDSLVGCCLWGRTESDTTELTAAAAAAAAEAYRLLDDFLSVYIPWSQEFSVVLRFWAQASCLWLSVLFLQ